jgi:O-acetylserine/cysteine efflux transporter
MTPRDIFLACLVSLVWGLAFVFVKFGLEDFSASQLTVLRFVMIAIPALFLPRPRVGWGLLIGTSLFLFLGQFLLLFFAYRAGLPPGLASVAVQMHVFFTVALAALLLRERPNPMQSLGMAIAFIGLVLIGMTAGAQHGGDLPLLALILVVVGAINWAIGNLLVKRIGPTPMLPLMAWLSLVPPLPAFAISLLLDDQPPLWTALAHASALGLISALYLGLVATVLGYGLWSFLLTRYPTASVAPFALLTPVTGVVASAILFGERFPPLRYAGMAMILIGLAVLLLPARLLRWR